MRLEKFSYKNIPIVWISIAIFLFGALSLTVSSGYTYGPVFLLLPALIYLGVLSYPRFSPNDKLVIAALLIFAGAGSFTGRTAIAYKLRQNITESFGERMENASSLPRGEFNAQHFGCIDC